ncbi:hypothetical protein UFOVP844_9 [uncultured Caudovirales phage]|uniref:Uncharacterized protein n=1 Tax=uncultured Caudovirales phage TaxID=2100421 RepID=A0A6J5P458_9CAUD|nr:hypothetical protein UFOVP844_9 [uncultured Caudovirales phage]
MNFLPADYEAPKTSSNGYLKLQEGENRIRILSAPILGWEDWLDKKPIRYRMENKPKNSIDPKKPFKHFWAFIVFNYVTEQIQIMQITQATIRRSLEGLCKDADWGAPYGYDIKITKSGEGVDTEYTINPVPHKSIDPYILKCFAERPINLNALYSSEDPFAGGYESYTRLGTEPIEVDAEIEEMLQNFEKCDSKYKHELMLSLEGLPQPVYNLRDIPKDLRGRIKAAIAKNMRKEVAV